MRITINGGERRAATVLNDGELFTLISNNNIQVGQDKSCGHLHK